MRHAKNENPKPFSNEEYYKTLLTIERRELAWYRRWLFKHHPSVLDELIKANDERLQRIINRGMKKFNRFMPEE